LSKKKLMVLGAGVNQLPLIKKAVKMDFFVITVDNIPGNIGHTYSHQFINCSTVCEEEVLKAAKTLNINGIVTMASDIATPAAALVAEQLGLPGGNYKAAAIMSNKAEFRRFQEQNGLNGPGYVIGCTIDEVKNELPGLTPPLVFKPVDVSGSRGISKVEKITAENIEKAFTYAQKFSRSGKVCIEEYVEGIDLSGDGFIRDGKIEFAVITKKIKKGFIPVGHLIPSDLPAEIQEKILGEIEKTCVELGYLCGPFDFDVCVNNNKIVVLEIGCRLGGNGIPQLIEFGTGIDLIGGTILSAVGKEHRFPGTYRVKNPCGSWIFGSSIPGTLKNIADEKKILSDFPGVFFVSIRYKKGGKVQEFEHNANALGYILFKCANHVDYRTMVKQLENSLNIHVE